MPSRPARYRPPTSKAASLPIERRGTAAERGYDHRWRQARLSFLAEHPLCVTCEAKGLTVEATTVDHVVPHKGDPVLFWDRGNWQALCKPCHDHKTATEDGAFGRPVMATPTPPAPA
jgi:5-methylcytosine-specific restriction protein A